MLLDLTPCVTAFVVFVRGIDMLKTVWNTLYQMVRVQVSAVVARGIADGTADGINAALAEIEATAPTLPAPAVVVIETTAKPAAAEPKAKKSRKRK